jgi:hypothetical protein
MAQFSRSLIANKEVGIPENGLQQRDANPSSPVENNIWINTTTNKISYFDGVIKDVFDGYVQTTVPNQVVEMGTNAINYNLGRVFRRQNLGGAGTTTITFSNIIEGETIIFIATTDPIGGGTTLAFGAGAKINNGTNLALPAGDGAVYRISQIDGVRFVEQLYKNTLGSWPSGAQGNLTIINGQTFVVSAGQLLDYNNVTINAGGTLLINGTSSQAVTVLGVAGNLVVNGQIVGRYYGNGYNVSRLTPRGETVSRNCPQNAGGRGGRVRIGIEGDTAVNNRRTLGVNGLGGGGTGGDALSRKTGVGSATFNGLTTFFYSSTGTRYLARGGVGASSQVNGSAGEISANYTAPIANLSGGAGGIGNSSLGNGTNGTNGYATSTAFSSFANGGNGGNGLGGGGGAAAGTNTSYLTSEVRIRCGAGGGGGGGNKGQHGLPLYIFCLGTFSGNGSILLNGTNGFNGGNGGLGTSSTSDFTSRIATHGGGGAGGAGGSGGALWVRFGTNSFVGTINVSGGTGGGAGNTTSGGDGFISVSEQIVTPSTITTDNATNGANGSNGTSNLAPIV